MRRQIERLERVHAQLAAIPVKDVPDAATQKAIVEGLADLEQAIAYEAKLAAFTDTMPDSFDAVRFAADFCGYRGVLAS